MGIDLKNNPDSYSFHNFVKEIFFDSETSMCVISGVPGREIDKDSKGEKLEGKGSQRRYLAELVDGTIT